MPSSSPVLAAPSRAACTSEEHPAYHACESTGFLGRNLARHIHDNRLASTLRLVDKQLPQLASLAPEFEAACASDANFLQADASRDASQARIFDLPPGPDGAKREFDYVFNCGGETRFSQDDEVYKLRSLALSATTGREAARRGARAFVECSTGQVYNSSRAAQKEGDKTSKPHTKLARWKLAAEEELARVGGLRLVVLRFPHVYGPYSAQWLGTQLAMARLYQERSRDKPETMKYLWSSDMRTNTLHVEDAARALWAAAEWRAAGDGTIPSAPANARPVFNVVDRGNTTQGTMAGIVRQVFGIETGFQNALVNTFARLNLEHVVDEVNDDTLDDWADLQQDAGIKENGGPLTPFMEVSLTIPRAEGFNIRRLLITPRAERAPAGRGSMSGREPVRERGWIQVGGMTALKKASTAADENATRPKHERINKAEVEHVIESYKRMGWWP